MQTRFSFPFGLVLAIVLSGTFSTLPIQAIGQSQADTVAASDSFTPMALTTRAKPVYPDECRKRGIEAVVHVGFMVSERGDVSEIFKVRTEFDGGLTRHMDRHRLRRFRMLFEHSALDAVRQFKFEPATLNGKPMASRICDLPIRFVLH